MGWMMPSFGKEGGVLEEPAEFQVLIKCTAFLSNKADHPARNFQIMVEKLIWTP